ncbi:hypothetical protein HanXRQr2_Chr11g0479731 [Helianthus annuus]|uniref:Uncharacterized protein n=1 Tax=Helianthus annuus TaxID=4232 RepID=A0A9K3MZ56_HELAN|nr:hypothetical protein HanXRQr2_Chr11g0479731 [Helianthus annuus]
MELNWSKFLFIVAFQSRGRVGIGEPLEIRVLSGVQFLESLCLFASAVQ